MNPLLVLSEMPDSMRIAFEKMDMDMLKAVQNGHDKKVNEEKFWIWMHKAEDSGLWETGHFGVK